MKRILTILICFFISINCFADGTLTDGGASLTWQTTNLTEEGRLSWELNPGGDDHAYQLWFWYRIDGELFETILAPPTSELFLGNTATLNFSNVDGKLFDVEMVLSLTEISPNEGDFSFETEIINNTGAQLDIDFFVYLDLDKSDFSYNRAFLENGKIVTQNISSLVSCAFRGNGSTAYKVEKYPDLYDRLGDALIDDFDNATLPFETDVTTAFQWALTIAPGASSRISSGVHAYPGYGVPTLGEWGLSMFYLLFLNISAVILFRKKQLRVFA